MKKIITISIFLIVISLKSIISYGTDLTDCALLYNSTNIKNFDINFPILSQYYGLKCKLIDLSAMI